MIIYCWLHRENHKLTDRDAEDLIHSLTAEWAEFLRGGHERRADLHLLPGDMVRVFRDGEMYAEHLESMRESRIAASGLGAVHLNEKTQP